MENKALLTKIYQDFKHAGSHIVIKESSIARGYQFKTLVNGISLGCYLTEDQAKNEAIRFSELIYSNKKTV